MNDLLNFAASIYFFAALLARISAALVFVSGLAYGSMAMSMQRQYAGLDAGHLFAIGLIGSFVFVLLGELFRAAGNCLVNQPTAPK